MTLQMPFTKVFHVLVNVRFLLATSLALHWFLVVVHIGLFLLQRNPPPPYNVNNLGFTTLDALLVAITAGPTAVFKVYSIILIALTQLLALDRRIHCSVSLAAFCDEYTAWQDVGPALKAFWKQKTVRTAPWTILLILAYLSCIVGLGLTTPAMVQVAQVTLNASMLIDIPQALSYVSPQDVQHAFTTVSLLPILGLIDVPGVEGNTIFDVLQLGGYETTQAQAVWFDVRCHYIDGLQQSSPGQYRIQNNTIQYAFHVDDNLEDIYISPANRSINIVTAKPKNVQDPAPLTLFVASTVPIAEDSRHEPNRNTGVPYAPPINVTLIEPRKHSFNDTSLYIVACNMFVNNGTVSVTSNGNYEGLTDNWLSGEFREPLSSWNLTRAPKSPGPLGGLADFPSLSPPSGIYKSTQLRNDSVSGVFTPTLLEATIANTVGLDFEDDSATVTIPPDDVEAGLEVVLAMVYWRAQLNLQMTGMVPAALSTTEDAAGLQIQINQYMPLTGLALSAIAAISSMILSMQKRNERVIERPTLVQTLILLSDDQVADLAEKATQHAGLDQSEALLAASKGIVVYVEDGRILLKGEAIGKPLSVDSAGRPTLMARIRRRFGDVGRLSRRPARQDDTSQETLLLSTLS
ncbi:hypothetical protein NM688_g4363 [Phlebia brevispora]|uniref:Uncharacterized protein n=1 Tax=Phlebia brevispora TaxID=194682 RepID=A0ACC1T3I4_9APHY|nr:hypothetical protein NM688_g4363 [Phlebia brevispora]